MSRCTKESFHSSRAEKEKLDGKRYLLSYDSFHELNTKTKGFTRGDIWARQLLTIRGVSAEKASAILKKFPTMMRYVFLLNYGLHRVVYWMHWNHV